MGNQNQEQNIRPNPQGEHLYREFESLVNKEVLIITRVSQLNLLGQTFRPIFCGRVAEVYQSCVILNPVIIKMVNAPFYQFPTPLAIPFERITSFTTEIGCDTVFPLT